MKRFVLMLALSLLAAPVLADDVPEFTIVIKDHQFTPAELAIPAGVKVKRAIARPKSLSGLWKPVYIHSLASSMKPRPKAN